MIAKTSSGRRFGALASYLAHGRTGVESDRVAWTASRNLGTDDPEMAAALMQATARQSALVNVPVYHLTISFDRQDQVTPEGMQAVADRVLNDLGLSEHQALMVAHRDRAHAHVHLMVNRVHPETGVAWERWQDRPVIERALREQERVLGLREVPGRLHALDGQDARRGPAQSPVEQRLAERDDDRAFQDRVRALLPPLRTARSWDELEARLAAQNLRVEGKGQGLVVTDGVHEVKASRVARDFSLRRLEDRFGAAYPHREQLRGSPAALEAGLSEAAIEVAATTRECERLDALTEHASRIDRELARLHALRQAFEFATQGVQAARERFDRELAQLYRDPEAARALIRSGADSLGRERVATLLRVEPEQFGALRTVPQPRALGLLTVHDDAAARFNAPVAAMQWRDVTEREATAIASAQAYVRGTEARLDEAFAAVYRAPAPARAAFELALANAGTDDAVRTLAQTPDRFGALRAPGTPVPVAHLAWQALGERAHQAVEARQVTSSELAFANVDHAIARINDRRRELNAALGGAPSRDLLGYALSRATHQLAPNEIIQLRRVLTAPQAAIVFKARGALRDVVLGRDERER